MNMRYSYELFEFMPRSGPGSKKSTGKAFEMIEGLSDNPIVLDIGCGQGLQTGFRICNELLKVWGVHGSRRAGPSLSGSKKTSILQCRNP